MIMKIIRIEHDLRARLAIDPINIPHSMTLPIPNLPSSANFYCAN